MGQDDPNRVRQAVEICSLAGLVEKVGTWKPDRVVSLVPAGHERAHEVERVAPRTAAFIEDVMNQQLSGYKQAIRQVLALREARILFHCEHGRSRSGALAIVKAYQTGGSSAVRRFLDDNPQAEPNPLLLLLADEIMSTAGALVALCGERYKGRRL